MNLISVKYSENTHCPKCNGLVTFDARLSRKLPLGFGFAPDSSSFQVDYVHQTGWRGECMTCMQPIFAIQTTKHVTCKPRNINAKLAALR